MSEYSIKGYALDKKRLKNGSFIGEDQVLMHYSKCTTKVFSLWLLSNIFIKNQE
ncbi:virulence RhuM family protein [Clostridium frigoris]|uniref:virulence RhuM family protein n=1 Tax=Clostridium frigoris TaxID=205327 RepID=UPI001FE89CDD|nr:virulence RhuM family protein [Clostridium frigoris]